MNGFIMRGNNPWWGIVAAGLLVLGELELSRWASPRPLDLGSVTPDWASAAVSVLALVVSAIAVVLVKRTLDATRQANVEFKESAERQLRAYLTPFEGPKPNLAPGQVPEMLITFRNTGQTPAYKASCIGLIYFRPMTDPEPAMPAMAALANPSGNTVGRECDLPFATKLARTLTAADIAAMNAGTAELGIAVRVEYKDAFDADRFVNYRAHTWRHPSGGLFLVTAPHDNDAN